MSKRKNADAKTPVDQATIDACLANVVAEGDIVNFRFLFVPYSPLRDDSTENIESPKYAYLFPEDEEAPRYREALGLVKQVELRAHVKSQLQKKGPAQLPSELLLMLADNAVRLGKCTAAAQAYELLRIRRRMQEEFFVQADKALDENNLPLAVHGYIIATGLDYDYAAFPEPLPAVPNYQVRALMLHAEYPKRPEDCVALQPPEVHTQIALSYLLLDAEAAARLESRPLEQKLEFVERLVRQRDPAWDAFVARYKAACGLVDQFARKIEREANRAEGVTTLAAEIEAQLDETDPKAIPAALLGRDIPNGEWWQYLKELAYEHPAAALFVGRQAISKDTEIIMPRLLKESPLALRLGIG